MNFHKSFAQAALTVLICVILSVFVVCSGGARLTADSPVTLVAPARVDFVDRGPSLQSPAYRAIVAASVRTRTGLAGVVSLQILVAATAAIRLMTVARALGGRAAGFAAVSLFTLNPDQVRWHAYVLPDSLYTSVLLLAVAAIHDAAAAPTAGRLLAALGCGLTAGTLNATGYLLAPIAAGAWLVAWGKAHRAKWLAPTALVAALLAVVVMLPAVKESTMISTTGHEPPNRGVVVRDYQESWLPMPVDRGRPGATHEAGLTYAIDHPRAILHLAALRILAVLAHVRPYYAPRHNLALLGLLLPLYGLAVLGLIAAHRKPLAALVSTVITVHLLVAALTCSDWDGRSLSLALPLIGVLASRGLVMIRAPRWVVVSLGIPAMLTVLFHPSFLTLLAHQFRVNNPAPSDALVLLLGGDRDRPHKAAELYRDGMGPVVLVGADSDLRLNRDALIDRGVASADILSLGPTIGTREEAWRVRAFIDKHPEIRRITIVTTAFHTARACWIFRRALSGTGVDIHAAASDDPRFNETDWYTKADGVRAYSQEIVKLAYAFLCGVRECPLEEREVPVP